MKPLQFTMELDAHLHSLKAWEHCATLSELERMIPHFIEQSPRLFGYWCTLTGSSKRIALLEAVIMLGPTLS